MSTIVYDTLHYCTRHHAELHRPVLCLVQNATLHYTIVLYLYTAHLIPFVLIKSRASIPSGRFLPNHYRTYRSIPHCTQPCRVDSIAQYLTHTHTRSPSLHPHLHTASLIPSHLPTSPPHAHAHFHDTTTVLYCSLTSVAMPPAAAPTAIPAAMTKASEPTTKKSIVQIGCGIVGHAYARAFVEGGHDVLGIEASRLRMEQVSAYYRMRHVSENLSNETNVDFILLSINTPLDESTGALSMRYLWSSLGNVVTLLRANPDALVVIRSTVTLGFCAAYRAALTRELSASTNTTTRPRLCFQPEFLRAKSALSDALNPWHVVLGADSVAEIRDYAQFQMNYVEEARISYCTIDEAEVMKIFHNSFNAAKISYFNQAAMLIDRVNERDGKAIDAAATFKLISKTCEGLLNPMYGLTPGHAYYGTCLPKDSAELAHMEKDLDLESDLFSQVVNVNHVMKRSDVAEVLHGDNHVDSQFFHQATASAAGPAAAAGSPGTKAGGGNGVAPIANRGGVKEKMGLGNENVLSMVSLVDADKVSDSSVDSS